MRKTKNFNISVPELGDRPDITQVSNAIQDLEDALSGTVEMFDGNVQGNTLTLTSPSRTTKRTKYYNGFTCQWVAKAPYNANTITNVNVDELGNQAVTIGFNIRQGDAIQLKHNGTRFEVVTLNIPRSNAVDSSSDFTIATSLAVKTVNDKITKTNNDKLDKGGYTGTAQNLKNDIDVKANKTVQIKAGNGLTGGGDLTSNRVLNVVSSNSGIRVNADNIELMTLDSVASTDKIRPASANAVKLAYDKGVNATNIAEKSEWFINAKPIGNSESNIDILELCTTLEPGFYVSKSANNKFISLPKGISASFYLLVESIGGGYRKITISDHFNNTTCYNTYRSIQGAYSWEGWSKVYQEDDKPTPSEIGAVDKKGDTMTGDLILNDSLLSVLNPSKSGSYARGMRFYNYNKTKELGGVACYGESPDDIIRINLGFGTNWWSSLSGLAIYKDNITFKDNKIYHAGNKPTPAEIGALAEKGVADSVGRDGLKMTFERGNEVTLDTPSSSIWFGYRKTSGEKITQYNFGNGYNSIEGVELVAEKGKFNSLSLLGSYFDYTLPNTTSAHARGINYLASNGNTTLGGIGEYGDSKDVLSKFSLGFGSNWWSLERGGLVVFPTELRHGIYGQWRVYSEGFKPTQNDVGLNAVRNVASYSQSESDVRYMQDIRFTGMTLRTQGENYATSKEWAGGVIVTACTYDENANVARANTRQLQKYKNGSWVTITY